jgi:hypothetical protein
MNDNAKKSSTVSDLSLYAIVVYTHILPDTLEDDKTRITTSTKSSRVKQSRNGIKSRRWF